MRTKSGDLICRPSLRCIYVPSDTQQIYQEGNHRPSLPTLTRLFSRPLTARLEGYTCVIFCVTRPVYFCALSGHRTNTRTLCLIIGQSWRHFICAPAHLIGSPNWRIRFARSYLAKLTASYRRREVKGQTQWLTADMVQNNTSRKSGPWTRSELQLLMPWWGKVARIYKSSDCNCMFIIKVQLFYIATGRFTFAIAKFTNFMATPPGFGLMSSSTFYARRLTKYWNNNYKLKIPNSKKNTDLL